MPEKITMITAMMTMLLAGMTYAQQDTITILHINDTHSCIAPLAPRTADLSGTVGGIARLATVVKEVRNTNPNVLFLHAGDYSVGDPVYNATFGVAELTLLRKIGLDAMTLGNHEFDLGPSTLEATFATIAGTVGLFPVLSANLVYPPGTSTTLATFVSSYTVEELGKVKVGVFGLTTPQTNQLSQPSPLSIDGNLGGIAAAMVDTLKSHGCSVIILLSHLGEADDQSVASDVAGIDAIVGGHDHIALTSPVPVVNPAGDTTWIVQTGAYYEFVGKLRLVVDAGKARLLDYDLIHLDNSIPEDSLTKAAVDSISAVVEASFGQHFYSKRISFATGDFGGTANASGGPDLRETPAGDLVTDAFRDSLKTDIGLTAEGLISQPLHKGPIVGADVFRMLCYGFNTDNRLGYRMVTFKMTGLQIMEVLELTLASLDQNDQYQIEVSGMSYSYAPDALVGSRLRSVSVGGVPVNPMKEYSIATNEMVLHILDEYASPLAGGIAITDPVILSGVTEYQVVYSYIASRDTISPKTEGRITPVVQRADEAVPHEFMLDQNYPNPFNPSTTINYQISMSSYVTLSIYDALGREVKTLINGQQAPGYHSVILNATGLSSGVYFYRLQAGSYSRTRKLVLLK